MKTLHFKHIGQPIIKHTNFRSQLRQKEAMFASTDGTDSQSFTSLANVVESYRSSTVGISSSTLIKTKRTCLRR
jgi:hypothetical protein